MWEGESAGKCEIALYPDYDSMVNVRDPKCN